MSKLLSVLAAAALISSAHASERFYVGYWAETDCDTDWVMILTPSTARIAETECIFHRVEVEGTEAVAQGLCYEADLISPVLAVSLMLSMDGEHLRITDAEAHKNPRTYRRCTP